jgi:hypothetical protein
MPAYGELFSTVAALCLNSNNLNCACVAPRRAFAYFSLLVRLASLSLLLGAGGVHASTARPMQFDEIVGAAQLAFHGKAVSMRSERDSMSNMIVTYTTFEVLDPLKGTMGNRVTVKQVGGILDETGEVFRIHGVPRYEVGLEYVLFLHGVSRWGLTSPVGLGQGAFSVSDEGGVKWTTNGRDFRVMAPEIVEDQESGMEVVPYRPIPRVALADLKRIAREHVRSKQAAGAVE